MVHLFFYFGLVLKQRHVMYVTPLSLFKDFLFFSTPVSSQTHTTMLFKFELIIHPFQSELNKLSPLSGFEPGTSPVAIIEVHLFICYYLNIKLWMVVVYFNKILVLAAPKSWPKYNFLTVIRLFCFLMFFVFSYKKSSHRGTLVCHLAQELALRV